MHTHLHWRSLAFTALVVCLATGAASARAAAASAGHAAADHSAAGGAAGGSHGASDGHGDLDFNKPPLPGFAPGLGPLFLFSLALFGGFVLSARWVVWNPLIAALDAREARIVQAETEAAAAQAEAERLHASYAARMAEVHEKVQGILLAARKSAEQEKSRIIADAEAHARQLRDEAIRDIHTAREAALAEVERSLDREVELAVTQIVGHRVA